MNDIEKLRSLTGVGLMECKSVLKESGGDRFLAAGLIRYKGLAVAVRPKPGETRSEAYRRWVWDKASAHAEKLRDENAL